VQLRPAVHDASPGWITVQALPFALLHAVELPAGPGGSKHSGRSLLHSSRSWQLPSGAAQVEPSVHVVPFTHVVPSTHTPSHLLVVLLKSKPLLKQSISFLHCSSVRVLAAPTQALLQSLNNAARFVSAAQSGPNPLITQFKAIAVSWRAFCSLLFPFTGTHIASTADMAVFTLVLMIFSPQTLRHPVKLITCCVMFWLPFFSVPACVPQKPGVRQMASLHVSGQTSPPTPVQEHWLPEPVV